MIRLSKDCFTLKYYHILLFVLMWVVVCTAEGKAFGFHAHRIINRMAVYTLPPEMVGLYKQHIEFLAERSIDPDRRAHVVEGEAPRHYIDIDHFGETPFRSMPRGWNEAKAKYSQDTLLKYGVLPWHIDEMAQRLTMAFRRMDLDQILINSAHLGHYIADACTPLHTTLHYNGRTPAERGIHALWESRLPELFAHEYDYLTGRAEYIPDLLERAWELIEQSHGLVAQVYHVYDSLHAVIPADQIYVVEMRGQATGQHFSRTFSAAFHRGLEDMVEHQMQKGVKTIGDFWFTAWVNAGQPQLDELSRQSISQRLLQVINSQELVWGREKESVERPVP